MEYAISEPKHTVAIEGLPKTQIAGAMVASELANLRADAANYGGTGLYDYNVPDYSLRGEASYMDKGVKFVPLIILLIVIYLVWWK